MGYTNTQYLPHNNASDANFRTWGNAISAAFTAAGWTKTADTGQVNWSTVTVPAANGLVYEIWQPSDALQTGATRYYVKVQYGNAIGGTNQPIFKFSLGTATDGAGTLTGQLSATDDNQFVGLSGVTTNLFECNFSGESNRIGIMMWRNTTVLVNGAPAMYIFCVERTKNLDGTDSTEGVTLFFMRPRDSSGRTLRFQHTIIFGAGPPLPATNNFISLMDTTNTSSVYNSKAAISPMFPVYGRFGNPHTVLATCRAVDVAEASLVTATLYGASRTYLATKLGFASAIAPEGGGNGALLFRFD